MECYTRNQFGANKELCNVLPTVDRCPENGDLTPGPTRIYTIPTGSIVQHTIYSTDQRIVQESGQDKDFLTERTGT